ncbi:MAG: GNAT family N-acetyltransferase [Steroidobacteraceae bacterium]
MTSVTVPSGEGTFMIRDALPDDFAVLLELNSCSEHFLSPLPTSLLQSLHRQSWYHRVSVSPAGGVQGFLIALADGAEYASVNYRWFAARYPSFVYIDRVVVAAAARGRGVAKCRYDDLIRRATAEGRPCITCEFDIDPPNEASARFHARYGFQEVGTQCVGDGKQVSLQRLDLHR